VAITHEVADIEAAVASLRDLDVPPHELAIIQRLVREAPATFRLAYIPGRYAVRLDVGEGKNRHLRFVYLDCYKPDSDEPDTFGLCY
jgi:hypothetical protein